MSSRPDKYNPYVSQLPVEVNPNSRSSKRRRWKNSWKLFLAQEGKMNYIRQTRRLGWKSVWNYFRDGMVLENVNENNNDNNTEVVNEAETVNETVSEVG